MKYYPLLLRCLHAPVIRSSFVVLAALFLSKSVLAMPYAHNASFSRCGDPDHSRGYYINSWSPMTEKTGASATVCFLGPQTKLFLSGVWQEKDSLPLNGDGVNSMVRDAAAVGDNTPATSYPTEEAAPKERSLDLGEHDKQDPLKLSLLNVSIRATFSSTDLVGAVAPEEFREYGVAANIRLPWGWYSQSGWGAGIRLLPSAGALHGGGETALVLSFIPLLALGSQDGRFTLDMGAGGALLSRHHFGTQDFGGYFQFALTVGLSVPLFKQLGVGYRFQHYSDAGIYGPENTGADMHMLELTYRF